MTKQKSQAETAEQKELLRNLPPRMDIRVDWAFKYFFSEKKHLLKFIKDLLDMDIEVIEYHPNGLIVTTDEDKKSVFDVICKNCKTGEVFVLEMQTTYESDMADRLYYYGCSLIHNQVKSGDKVYTVQSVLICCIADYRVPHKVKVPVGKVFFQYKMRESETHEIFDGDKLKICFLELTRFDNYLDKGADLEKQWCWIFNNLSTFVNRPEYLDSSFDEVISDAGTGRLSMEEKLKYMEAVHLNERERIVVHQGGYILGKEEGLAEGRNEGRNEERIKNAKAMLAKQYPVSDIAEITGLSEAEICSLE